MYLYLWDVNFEENRCCSVFQTTSPVQVCGFSILINLNCAWCILFPAMISPTLNFYLTMPFLPDLSLQASMPLSLHWRYHIPHLVLQTKLCTCILQDSVASGTVCGGKENKVTGDSAYSTQEKTGPGATLPARCSPPHLPEQWQTPFTLSYWCLYSLCFLMAGLAGNPHRCSCFFLIKGSH